MRKAILWLVVIVVVGVVVALYEGFATPDRVMLRHALNGIAF